MKLSSVVAASSLRKGDPAEQESKEAEEKKLPSSNGALQSKQKSEDEIALQRLNSIDDLSKSAAKKSHLEVS